MDLAQRPGGEQRGGGRLVALVLQRPVEPGPVAERVPLTPHPNDHNLAYLRTKRDRMGHDIADLPDLSVVTLGASSAPSKGDPT